MSDKVSQLYERALRNLKTALAGAWARRNRSRISSSRKAFNFPPRAQRSAFRRAGRLDLRLRRIVASHSRESWTRSAC